MKRYMTCCVCGEFAGRWQQHHNQDTGWGICTGCVVEQTQRYGAAEVADLYGKPGINYEEPSCEQRTPCTSNPATSTEPGACTP